MADEAALPPPSKRRVTCGTFWLAVLALIVLCVAVHFAVSGISYLLLPADLSLKVYWPKSSATLRKGKCDRASTYSALGAVKESVFVFDRIGFDFRLKGHKAIEGQEYQAFRVTLQTPGNSETVIQDWSPAASLVYAPRVEGHHVITVEAAVRPSYQPMANPMGYYPTQAPSSIFSQKFEFSAYPLASCRTSAVGADNGNDSVDSATIPHARLMAYNSLIIQYETPAIDRASLGLAADAELFTRVLYRPAHHHEMAWAHTSPVPASDAARTSLVVAQLYPGTQYALRHEVLTSAMDLTTAIPASSSTLYVATSEPDLAKKMPTFKLFDESRLAHPLRPIASESFLFHEAIRRMSKNNAPWNKFGKNTVLPVFGTDLDGRLMWFQSPNSISPTGTDPRCSIVHVSPYDGGRLIAHCAGANLNPYYSPNSLAQHMLVLDLACNVLLNVSVHATSEQAAIGSRIPHVTQFSHDAVLLPNGGIATIGMTERWMYAENPDTAPAYKHPHVHESFYGLKSMINAFVTHADDAPGDSGASQALIDDTDFELWDNVLVFAPSAAGSDFALDLTHYWDPRTTGEVDVTQQQIVEVAMDDKWAEEGPLFDTFQAISRTHFNTVKYDHHTGDLWVNVRNQDNVVYIAYEDGAVPAALTSRWSIRGDFAVFGMDGEQVDTNRATSPLRDQGLFSKEHMTMFFSVPGYSPAERRYLTVFDNNNIDIETGACEAKDCHSRGRVFDVDLVNHTAKMLMDAPMGYSPIIGTSQLLSGRSHAWFVTGSITPDGYLQGTMQFARSELREYDMADGALVFGIDAAMQSYRSTRMASIYEGIPL
jgi:hypothetical protein